MQDSFSSLIDSASSVLILLPQKPYFDQVAAGLGLCLSLGNKKNVSIACASPMIVEFNRLVGIDKIGSDIGNKNLVVKFVNYNPHDVERVSADIENGEFKLTVIPKPDFPAPKKEQVELSFSGVAADTAILIGGGNESHFPQLASDDLKNAQLVHIGTRDLSLAPGRNLISFARPASSLSEVVAALIEESGLEVDEDIATNLLQGIEEGSQGFKTGEVTAETFEVFAKLLRLGGKRVPKEREVKHAFPFSPGVPSIKFQEAEKKEEPPKEWLGPKIFKGTSIS